MSGFSERLSQWRWAWGWRIRALVVGQDPYANTKAGTHGMDIFRDMTRCLRRKIMIAPFPKPQAACLRTAIVILEGGGGGFLFPSGWSHPVPFIMIPAVYSTVSASSFPLFMFMFMSYHVVFMSRYVIPYHVLSEPRPGLSRHLSKVANRKHTNRIAFASLRTAPVHLSVSLHHGPHMKGASERPIVSMPIRSDPIFRLI